MSNDIDDIEDDAPSPSRGRMGQRVDAVLLGMILGTRIHQGIDEHLDGGSQLTWYGFEPTDEFLDHAPGMKTILDKLPRPTTNSLSVGISMLTGDGMAPGANSTRWPKLAPNEANLYDLVHEEAARLVPDEDTVVGGCMIGGDMYDIELVLPFVKLKSFCDTMVAHGVHPVANVIPATDDQEVMSA